MINFEEELKKFKPCLEIDGVENAVKESDLSDVIDLLRRDAAKSAPAERPAASAVDRASAPKERPLKTTSELQTGKEDKTK